MRLDIAVIGAGIVGCAVARCLARDGHKVRVIDRDEPTLRATWAAAGMLAPQAESHSPDALLPLLLLARDGYADFASELEAETGMGVGYSSAGMLIVAFDDEEAEQLSQWLGWQREMGLTVERLTGDEARRLEPGLSPGVVSALSFPGDHSIDNRLLAPALRKAAAAAGAEFLEGREVGAVTGLANRPRVHVEGGDTLDVDRVVVCAGSWSGRISGLPRRLPVEPVHGQLISFSTAPPLLSRPIASARGYLVPRADGRVVAGTTVENMGYKVNPTPEGLIKIRIAALEMIPALGEAGIADHWAGLRPGTPDGLPIIGEDPDFPTLLYATGHYRNGILLGPLTGELVADLVSGRKPPLDLLPFSPARFNSPH